MSRLLLLTDAQLPVLPTSTNDTLVLLGPALALLWQQPLAAALRVASEQQRLLALAAELQCCPEPPVAVRTLADHAALAELVELATAVVAGG